MELSKFIHSKTCLAYIESIGHKYSDMELASIIWHSGASLPRKHRLLTELAAETTDQELRQQSADRVAYDERALALFRTSKPGHFYELACYEGKYGWCPQGHFALLEDALRFREQENPGEKFRIEKYQIFGACDDLITSKGYWNPRLFADKAVEDHGYQGDSVSSCHYNTDGELMYCFSSEATEEERSAVSDWGEKRFEDRFVSHPNPFECGDIVRCVDDPERMGIVSTNKAEWEKWLDEAKAKNMVLDHFDAGITVEFLAETGFSHGHPTPLELERVELSKDDKLFPLLTLASQLVKGGAWLEGIRFLRDSSQTDIMILCP